jgi:NADH dehydrogenase [ubiquinone] 1 alpha subcomplex assembly factor 5
MLLPTTRTLVRNAFPCATRLSSAAVLSARSFAAVAPGAPPPQATTPYEVFDRQAKRRQRDRAATRDGGEKSRVTDYLRTEVADRMFERFEVS